MSVLRTLEGKTFTVTTMGCRVNHYEAEAIVSMLEKAGALYEPAIEGPDIAIVVTCSITAVADGKTKKLLRRLKRENPAAAIVACGCFAQGAERDTLRALGVDVAIGNRMKHRLPLALERWFSGDVFVDIREDIADSREWEALSVPLPRIHTRAFVKIQDGCNRRCSYCIVPSLRGPAVSREPQDVYDEVARIVEAGCREVILTGVHIGSYRSGSNGLEMLIRRLSGIAGLKRLRLGSLEPFAVDEPLLAAMRESEIFCPHLHLPLQSGDDEVLRRMRRGYSRAEFTSIVRLIRKNLGDDVHLSTDLIVGFPGESEVAFANSLSLLQELSFGRVHAFPFSPRPGTDAAAMEDAVARTVVKERMSRAMEQAHRLLEAYAAKWVGREVSILTERADNGLVSGWTRHYLKGHGQSDKNSGVGKVISIIPKMQLEGILFAEGTSPENILSDFDE